MKTSELTGAALDWAVAKCEGATEEWRSGAPFFWGGVPCIRIGGHDVPYRPSTDWAQGGPIIEKMRGLKLKIGRKPRAPCYAHIVGYNGVERWHQTGKTPLIAAMRCYVASKLGDEVDVPEELL